VSESAGRVPIQLPRPGARLSTDDSLARRAAKGDERAFAAIYKRHHQELYRYCRAILRDPDDAQDALQATMVKALRALPGEEREIALKPWLFRIAHNEAISIARARRNPAALDPEAPDPLAGPELEAATRERLRQLVRDLDQLPERQRGSLVMRELSGLSFEEIGRVFDFSPAAAKQAVYEARVALQEIAEGREMECDLVREAISAQDRRVLRGRRIRAPLRGCERCTDFEAGIGSRRSDLALIAPPIAAPAAVATLGAVLGGSAAGGGAAAGAIGAGIAGGTALKTAAAVVATAVLAGGAAEISGVIDIGGSSKHESVAPAAQPDAAPRSDPPGSVAADGAGATTGSDSGRGPGDAGHRNGNGGGKSDDARGNGHGSHGNSPGHGQADAPGQAGTSPGQSGTAGSSAAAPGQTGTTPGQSGTAGNSATAPGHTGDNPAQSGTAGNSGSNGTQGASSNASTRGQANSAAAGSNASINGEVHGGGASTAPGQAGTVPGQDGSAGSSGDAPGHHK
jgi:RNA polymerase sigma factor (sigma-70 family)